MPPTPQVVISHGILPELQGDSSARKMKASSTVRVQTSNPENNLGDCHIPNLDEENKSIASPVLGNILRILKVKHGMRYIKIPGVPHGAVYAFIRFLYSSCYEEEELKKFVLHLLVLSHSYSIPSLRRVCICSLEQVGNILTAVVICEPFGAFELISDCKKCCTEGSDDSTSKKKAAKFLIFVVPLFSITFFVFSGNTSCFLNLVSHAAFPPLFSLISKVASIFVQLQITYSGAILEVCMRKLVFYPEIVGFIEEEKDKFPTVKIQYLFNSPPKLIMLDDDGQHKETTRIDNWKREHILQFLQKKVQPKSASS
ncbi:uncharacterized protein LOC120143262 [Hibiscus syriacus]|uniref:uncharacterized protein LOC120143262 n=1 Tax=Hibiscus syriacus TaxID=106335 RepID=UPI001921E462|nr:uncharacterized protein LOC120143262 [Hibiscus syriacus]